MSDDKLKNDPYSNPDMLKGDVIYPENVDPKTKRSGRIMISTLFIILPLSFVLGMIVFGRLSHNSTVTEVTQYVEVSSNRKGEVWGLSNGQLTTAEGTFTEWIVGSPENDEIPWFRDVAYHAGTDAVYLTAAADHGLYVILNNDGYYTEMQWLDLSLRVNGTIEQVISYDDDHLLLLANGDEQFALYNVVTDRVITSWPSRHQPDAPDTYFTVDFGGVVVDDDGRVFVLQTISENDEHRDEIQIFSGMGDYLDTVALPIKYVDFLTMTPNNTLFLHKSNIVSELDPQTKELNEVDWRYAFSYANDAQFHPNGRLYMLGGSQAWFGERLSNAEVGVVYPATENVSEMTSWPLGATGDPDAMTLLPDGSFVIIDGYINDFQRIFRLELPTP